MERKQFTFYASFAKAAERIKDDRERCAFYDLVKDYALYGNAPDLDAVPDTVAVALELIIPTLTASRRKAKNGKRGGCTKQTASKPEANGKQEETASKPEANGKQEETESKPQANPKQGQTPSKKEKENEKENENEIEVEVEKDSYTCQLPPSKAAAAVQADYLSRINASASPNTLGILAAYADQLGLDVCRRAFDIALDNKATTWNYIRAILQDWTRKGVKCLADLEKLDRKPEYQARKGAPPAGSAGKGELGELERSALDRMLGSSGDSAGERGVAV